MCSQSKWTLLHYAAYYRRLALIDPLVEMGSIIDAQKIVSEDPAAVPPIHPHQHPLLPTCSVPTPTPPLAPVSPCVPLHPHNISSILLTTHLALAYCLELFYP